MTGRIGSIDRIPLAISIGIEPTRPERAPAVRLDEDHQQGAVGAIAIAQQAVAGRGLEQLAVETEHGFWRMHDALALYCHGPLSEMENGPSV